MAPTWLVAAASGLLIGLAVGIAYLVGSGYKDDFAVLATGSVDGHTLPVVVPYRDVDGAILIEATLGEAQEAVTMMLDTGAPTLLTRGPAVRHADRRPGTVRLASADGRSLMADVVTLPLVGIGAARFRGVGAVVSEFAPEGPFACLSEVGLIGANLMRHAVWQVDPLRGTVAIARSIDGLDHVSEAITLRMTPSSGSSPSPVVQLPIGDGWLAVLIDTGSSGWLAANPVDLSQRGVDIPDAAPVRVAQAWSLSGPREARLRWLSRVPTFAGGWVAATDAVPEGHAIAGTAYLSHFVVTIDWPGETVYLDPLDAGSRPPFPAAGGRPGTSSAPCRGRITGDPPAEASSTERLASGPSIPIPRLWRTGG